MAPSRSLTATSATANAPHGPSMCRAGRSASVTDAQRSSSPIGSGGTLVVDAVVDAGRQKLGCRGCHHRASPCRVAHHHPHRRYEGGRPRPAARRRWGRGSPRCASVSSCRLRSSSELRHLPVGVAALRRIAVGAALRERQEGANLVGQAAGEDEGQHRRPPEGHPGTRPRPRGRRWRRRTRTRSGAARTRSSTIGGRIARRSATKTRSQSPVRGTAYVRVETGAPELNR